MANKTDDKEPKRVVGDRGKALNAWQATMREEHPEEYRAIHQRAAAVSANTRRKHRLFKTIYKELLSMDTEDPEIKLFLETLGIEPSYEASMALQTIRKANTGDIEANRYVRDTIGEKPTENYNMGINGKPIEALDLSQLTDEELEALASGEIDADEPEER